MSKPLGWVSKFLACQKAGIKFIHGVEIYLTEQLEPKTRDNYHTVLLAKNMDGVRELNSLVSRSCDKEHFYYVNRLSFDEFLSVSDNIITTSACLASPLNKLPHDHPRYMELAKKYTFLEVQPHNHPDQISFNRWLLELSQLIGTPLIAGTDTHSASPYKAECRKVLMAAKHKSYGNEDAFDLTYKTYDELADAFRAQGALPREVYLQAIENTNLLNELCEPLELDTSIKYPILYGSQEKDERTYEERVWQMLDDKLKNGVIPPEQETAFREALTEELRVFKKLHMGGFMLSMSELIGWCKQQGFAVGPARGSVGGSRAAYVTDIIDLNPEQWHTVFSRFCNEFRTEIGDIDVDVVESDRPAIFQYIINRFGADRTARVAAYGTLADKAVIKEVGRALRQQNEEKYSVANIDKIAKEYDADPEKVRKAHPDIFYYYDGLVGTKISQSVHPAGMIICPISLDDNYGVFDKEGESCIMLDMEEAHEVGLAKYDFLVLRNVEIIRDTCRYAGISYPKSYQVDFNDQKVWQDMMRSPVGIFQMERDYAFGMLKQYGAKSIEDMTLVTACIRPSGASYRDELIAHKPHKNPSPIIDELLKSNGGYLVYQEDTIKFLQQICGLSGGEADNVRRAIGRKQKDRLDAALPSILEGYCAKSSAPREQAEQEAKEFLQIIEDSASYQFGYNHAIAYSIIGYYCAWLRCYHPIEFITALLNNAANDDDISGGTELAKKYGIKVENPKWGISQGHYEFDKDKNTIAKGLESVKYMGAAAARELFDLSKTRNYTYFVDVLRDIYTKTSVNTRQTDLLIKIDFFSQFGNQRELLRIVDMFNLFKQGDAKQIKKDVVDGSPLEEIVKKYATGVTKSGGVAKNYTLLDVMAILRAAEDAIKDMHMEDLPDIIKIRNFSDVMGYIGYSSGKESDRRKLYLLDVKQLRRKSDGAQFGYSFYTKSIGSGKESRFTVFNKVFRKEPVGKGDIIFCQSFERDGEYFKLTGYRKVV